MLKITDEWRMSADTYSIALEQLTPVLNRKTQETTLVWKYVGYYGHISQALDAVVRHVFLKELSSPESMSYAKFVKNINQAIETLKLTIAPDVPEDVRTIVKKPRAPRAPRIPLHPPRQKVSVARKKRK